MAVIDLKLDPSLRAFLRRMLQGIFESLQESGKVRGYLPEDLDDQEFWIEGLKTENLEALEVLLNFVKNEAFGAQAIELSDEGACAFMRACSCLRLHLRETALKTISDEDLENAGLESEALQGGIREAFFVYAILAQLQSMVVEASDM